MSYQFIAELASKVRMLGFGRYTASIMGCTKEEIEQIKQAQNVRRLPEIYEQFLLKMGKGSGRLFESTDHTCERLVSMKQELEHQLKGNHAPALPPDAFVFLYDTADKYYWFRSDAGDDPPVFSMKMVIPNL